MYVHVHVYMLVCNVSYIFIYMKMCVCVIASCCLGVIFPFNVSLLWLITDSTFCFDITNISFST